MSCIASSGFNWRSNGNLQPPDRLAFYGTDPLEGIMGTDKSILEKLTDTVKDIATLATDAAIHALRTN